MFSYTHFIIMDNIDIDMVSKLHKNVQLRFTILITKTTNELIVNNNIIFSSFLWIVVLSSCELN